ncbi:MAG TPA: universal stress protein [Vicinamibacteria bacterium]|nr:universal stress protein [Vicinamibacteria bacterium]
MHCLLYVDPSHRGEWALRLGRLLTPALERLTLVATDEDAARDPALLTRAREALRGARALDEKRLPGPAERAIPLEAAGGAYDLVVVPPAGRGALQRMLKGSRVATVVRSVRASVLVARRPPERIAGILGAVSGGAATAGVIRATVAMEAALGARSAFLHVASEVALPYKRGRGGEQAPALDEMAAARALLAEAGRELLVREGLVVDEVLAEVEHGAYDLLVAGASSGEAAWGREDVTERILLRCPTSMLIARA